MGKDTGRCINCGFYGKQLRDETESVCYEATPTDRGTGRSSPFQGVKEVRPRCFRNKADYGWDIYKPPTEAELLTRISENRKCSFWYPYTENCSPKQHYEEYKMLELERRREEFEQKMERERKEFDLKLFELSQNIQQDSKEIVTKSDRFNRRITVFIIILAVLEVAGTFLALAFPNGIKWLIALFN